MYSYIVNRGEIDSQIEDYAYISSDNYHKITKGFDTPLHIVEILSGSKKLWRFLYHDKIIPSNHIDMANCANGKPVSLKIINKNEYPLAKSIIIECLNPEMNLDASAINYVDNIISSRKLPTEKGNQFTVKYKKNDGNIIAINFRVTNIKFEKENDNSLPCFISDENTHIDINNVSLEEEKKGFEKIGGLSSQIATIKEIIEFQFNSKEKLIQFGIKPSRGLLLVGPPGTGKTLIARSVANNTDAKFYSLNASELFSEFVGVAEKKLKEIFEVANKQDKAIIFIDEIDVIAANRDEAQEDLTRRLVNQFLPLMDGIKQASNIVVIGATNRPQAIDPAFKRPGRFDKDVHIKIPNRSEREEIFNIYLKQVTLDADFDMQEIIDSSYGFVGADIEAVCREQVLKILKNNQTHITSTGLNITVQNFQSSIERSIGINWRKSNIPNNLLAELQESEINSQIIRDIIKSIKNNQSCSLLIITKELSTSIHIAEIIAKQLDIPFVELNAILEDKNTIISKIEDISVYFNKYIPVISESYFYDKFTCLKIFRHVEIKKKRSIPLLIFTSTIKEKIADDMEFTYSLKLEN